MSKVRVYEVAKQLNMDPKAMVALFQTLGVVDVRNHMSAVESDQVERLKRHLERQKSPEVVEERIRPTVVKRRARTDAGEGIPSARPSSPGVPAPSPSQMGRADQPSRPLAPASEPTLRRRVPAAEPSRPSTGSSTGEIAPVSAASAASAHVAPATAPTAPVITRDEPIARDAPPSKPAVAPAERPSAAGKAAPSRRSRAGATPPAMEMFEPIDAPSEARPAAKDEAKAPSAAALIEAATQPAAEPAKPAEAPPPPASKTTQQVLIRPETVGTMGAASEEKPAAAAPASPTPAPQEAPREAAPIEKPAPSAKPVSPIAPPIEQEPARAAAPAIPPPAPLPDLAATPKIAPSTPPPPGQAPRRPSQPAPKTGIETWGGRPGVPMTPQVRTGPTPPRRTMYDPRQNTPPPRNAPAGFGPQGQRQAGQRPGQGGRQPFRKGPTPLQGGMRKSGGGTVEMASHKKVIKIEEQVSLQQLAAKMSLKATDVLMRLLQLGMTGVNINSTLDADTAKILAGEFGWQVEDVAVSESDAINLATGTDTNADNDSELRPPIVTVMGHVDHGKTSLLDRIRKASVAEGEAGGITQHIGAYRVETPRGTVAFLDTPGHEAFTEMRARGAKVTDLVILVVAADDGVMPQTREAFSHAQAAKVPIIVAVNKIDKPGADPEKIKRDLASVGLQTEEWGGDTMFVNVSAKTGQGVDQLLESILLQAEVLELKANPKKRAIGTVIEALLDRGRGPVARVMVQDGTLRTGDILLAGSAWGKVRAMTDELGRSVGEAGPSTPVEVLGLNEVPSAGDPVHSVKDARTAEEIADQRRKKKPTGGPTEVRHSLDTIAKHIAEAEMLELKLIIKGDVQGSVEAVGHALAKLSTQKVKVTIVHSAVGGITEGDVNLAVASKAIIVGFNVRPAGKAASLAEAEGVEIRLYNIIYNAVDDIRSAMEGLLPATKVEKVLGRAEVRQIFPIVKVGLVCGCMVLNGTVKRTADARLIRDNVVVWTGKLAGLRRFKDDVKEVVEGFECGISLDGYRDIKPGDQIECFEIEEVKTKLS